MLSVLPMKTLLEKSMEPNTNYTVMSGNPQLPPPSTSNDWVISHFKVLDTYFQCWRLRTFNIPWDMTFSLLTRKMSDRGNISSLFDILSLFPASSWHLLPVVQPLPKDCCYSIEPGKVNFGVPSLEFVKGHHCRMWNTQYLHLNSSKTLKKDWFDKLGTLLMKNAQYVYLSNHSSICPRLYMHCTFSVIGGFLHFLRPNVIPPALIYKIC